MGQLTQLERPRASGNPGAGALSRRQKAAIVVRLLVSQGADLTLRDLSDEAQTDLTQIIGSMRHIDRATLNEVVEEFTNELEGVGLTFPRGIAGALSDLDGRISPHTAARLRKEAGVRQTGDPWERLRGLEASAILPILSGESIEVAAIVLSKLDVSKAADLLGKLPGDRARRITYAVSQTSTVSPDALDRIGISLAAQIDTQRVSAFDKGPVERVGAILNSSTAATRDDMLSGLDETDLEFAEQVRRAIFTFINIPQRIAARDIPKVVRNVDQAALVTAIAAASDGPAAAAAEFILANMSGRMAEQIREEARDLGTVRPRDGEEAMTAIVGTVREMEATGDLLLLAGDDED